MSKSAEKRQRGSPTGATPQQRPMLSERMTKKLLSFSCTAGDSARARGANSWSALEERSLVEFVIKKGFVMATLKRLNFGRVPPTHSDPENRCVKAAGSRIYTLMQTQE